LVYQNHQDTLVGIPNYTLFRRERLRGKGGGVCAYVRSSISCSVFVPSVGAQSRVNDVEILWLDCTLHDCHYFVACCYDPSKPNYNYSVFIDVLSTDIAYINSMYECTCDFRVSPFLPGSAEAQVV